MRDIRDESSPYYSQYTEFDYWCYANAVNYDEDINTLWEDGADPEKEIVYTLVNNDGYMVPKLSAMYQELMSYLGQTELEETCSLSFIAYGTLPPELSAYYYGTQAEAFALFVEPVPTWLADTQPYAAYILPEGDVVMLGAPGDGFGQYDIEFADVNEQYSWSHYNAEGALVKTGEIGEHWHALFFNGYKKLCDQVDVDDNLEMFDVGQYLVVFHSDSTWENMNTDVYNHHGELLDLSYEELVTDSVLMQPLAGGMLALIHEAQTNLNQ